LLLLSGYVCEKCLEYSKLVMLWRLMNAQHSIHHAAENVNMCRIIDT